jgi:hypothetical protein
MMLFCRIVMRAVDVPPSAVGVILAPRRPLPATVVSCTRFESSIFANYRPGFRKQRDEYRSF